LPLRLLDLLAAIMEPVFSELLFLPFVIEHPGQHKTATNSGLSLHRMYNMSIPYNARLIQIAILPCVAPLCSAFDAASR
jgi:hypothetical protein